METSESIYKLEWLFLHCQHLVIGAIFQLKTCEGYFSILPTRGPPLQILMS